MLNAFVIGIGATLFMDLWALFQKRVLRLPSLDYALVGRWAGHLARGHRFTGHVTKAEAIPNERMLGWAIHYLTGLVLAVIFLAIAPANWIQAPTIGPALLFGAISVLAPFLILQPGLGAGIAASRTPKPNAARIKSLVTHLMFGFGLYLSGVAWVTVSG
ncbi:major facilitator superfamily permease [Hyphomonas jannaschiana VP2]|uniref:Major facilitator superfamily permease n=1 Tax=Hyphomonas jannaschiana VP2 TaxID=1280952 RepID=A0A059FF74_9PROT|nr:major facilitator superfamily permease [Hyphomonas jannaschiana VP2]